MKDLLEGLIISSVIDDSPVAFDPPTPILSVNFKTDPAQPSA
jgi:hypothetical protein